MSRSSRRAPPTSGVKDGNARIDVGVVQHTRVGRSVPDRRNGVEHHHGLHVRDAHVTDVKGGYIQAGGPRMEVDGQVGIGLEQPVEHQPGLAAYSTDAVFIAGPFAVHVDQLQAASGAWPAALHTFHRRACNVQHRHHGARHFRRVQPAHDSLHGVHRTHLIAMYTAGQGKTLTGLGTPGHDHRHVPVLSCGHLHTLEVQQVFFAGLQVTGVQRTHHFLAINHIPGVNGADLGRGCRGAVLGLRHADTRQCKRGDQQR